MIISVGLIGPFCSFLRVSFTLFEEKMIFFRNNLTNFADIMSDALRLTEKLKQREFKLNALLDMTVAINEQSSVEVLLNEFERILREHLHIEKLALYSKENKW